MPTELIAITGGIGSGKTIVSRILMAMGYEVYDCDSRARSIMDNDTVIRHRIASEIDEACVRNGVIDRPRLSSIVFSDRRKLETLNAIVHSAVRADITRWKSGLSSVAVFVETAILYESGLDRMVDAVWEVIAPENLRIARVISRSGLSESEVKSRIEAQNATVTAAPHPHVFTVINDGLSPLLPRIEELLKDSFV